MDIRVTGQPKIEGRLELSGSKNSIVALIPSSLLFDKKFSFSNVPEITDVERLVDILKKMGSVIYWDKKNETMSIDNSKVDLRTLNKEDLGSMRGTALLWGPLLARFGKLNFEELPGGCTLGVRSLNPHYEAFRSMGVKIEDGFYGVKMDSKNSKPSRFWLTEMSPTVTENVVMFATSIKGTTIVTGAASEPSVQDLCNFLISCGADIKGVGSNILTIKGGRKLTVRNYEIMDDHHELTTFLGIAAVCGGTVEISSKLNGIFDPIKYQFSRFGIEVKKSNNKFVIEKGQKPQICVKPGEILNVKAQPWPALPVDSLPLFIPMALASNSGQALFHNWMYEAGLFWTSELHKLGANVLLCDPHRILVTSGNKLKGATLESPFIIRATVSLLMCSLLAKGESIIKNADTLYRGHPHFSSNLHKLGVEIEEVNNT